MAKFAKQSQNQLHVSAGWVGEAKLPRNIGREGFGKAGILCVFVHVYAGTTVYFLQIILANLKQCRHEDYTVFIKQIKMWSELIKLAGFTQQTKFYMNSIQFAMEV